MSPDPTHDPTPEEHEAALLTAHSLGQTEGRERDELLARLARPDAEEARRIVDETRRIAEVLKLGSEESAQSPEAPGRSQDLRRMVIATLASQPATGKAASGPSSGVTDAAAYHRRRAPWGLLAAMGSLAAAILVIATLPLKAPREIARIERQGKLRANLDPKGSAVPPAAAVPQTAGKQAAADGVPSPSAYTPSHTPSHTMAFPSPDARGRLRTAKSEYEQSEFAKSSRRSQDKPQSFDDAPSLGAGEGGGEGRDANEVARQAQEKADRSDTDAYLKDRLRPVDRATPMAGDLAAGPNTRANAQATEAKKQKAMQRRSGPGAELAFDDVPGEGYERLEENRKRAVADEPLSTFSIDVDTASYANVRRFLSAGRLPPRDAVRIEELVNYFRYDDPKPDGDDPFSVAIESAASPWHDGRLLVRIGLKGREIERVRRPAGNIVFLVDVSGSMQEPDKLPLVKQAVAMLVEELTENDRVSIVTYAGDAGLVLPPTTGDQKQRILAAIEGLRAGGSTHGSAGIELAYEQAAEHFIDGGVNRVILATDGDLNVGVTSDAALVELIKRKAAGGTFLTVLGFGQGNLQDAKMEKIADNGNGIYAYIDGVREARKVLVEQLTGSTITIAKDVKIQVEFNPATVASYRLIGYENRLLAARDFRDDRKDAGEIGAGHSVTALYEIVPVGGVVGDVAASGAEPLKYQPQAQAAAAAKPAAIDGPASRELLTVKLRFKKPDGPESVLREFPLADRGDDFEAASADLRFAAAVAAFGMILRGSDEAGSATLDDVARIAGRAIGRDEGGYRAEFLDLVRKAGSLRGTSDP